VGKGQLKERCGLEPQTNFFPFKNSPKTECGLDSRIYDVCVCVYVRVVSDVHVLFMYKLFIWVGLAMCIILMGVFLRFNGVIVVSVMHDGVWLCCGFCASYMWCVTVR
jgi:hypothetical protein